MALKDKQKWNHTIVLSFTESSYASFMKDTQTAHEMIRCELEIHLELFPPEITVGYKLNGKTRVSKKLGIQMRKIMVGGINYQIRPSFILP